MRAILWTICVLLCVGLIGCEAATQVVPCCNLDTLRDALGSAPDGTVFQLGPGTFTGCPMFNSSYTTVLTNSFSYVGDPAGTTIDCAFGGSAAPIGVIIDPTANNLQVSFRDFTFARIGQHGSSIRVQDRRSSSIAISLTMTNITYGQVDTQTPISWSSNGRLTVTNVSMTQQYNPNGNGALVFSDSYGGTTITLTNILTMNTFIGCRGGAFYFYDGFGNGVVTIRNTTVIGANVGTAGGTGSACGGGAFWFGGSGSTFLVENSLLMANTAKLGGGGIMISPESNNAIILRNVTFVNNIANDQGISGALGAGGAFSIAGTGNNLTVVGCTFIGNSASKTGGGAIYAYGSGLSVTIINSKFATNSALIGGGLLLGGCNSVYSISNATFSGNSVYSRGGGISYTAGGANTLVVSNTNFLSNTANEKGTGSISLDGTGAGIFFDAGTSALTITGCSFIGNNATHNGGGLEVAGLAQSTTVTNSLFLGNIGLSGGGMELGGDQNKYIIDGCQFLNNTAIMGGPHVGAGIITQAGANSVNITNNQFSGNRAVRGSGLAVWSGTYQMILAGNTFTGNIANDTTNPIAEFSYGGGLYFHTGAGGSFTVSNSTFSNNLANHHGGAIAVTSTVAATYNIANLRVVNSAANQFGGGVAIFSSGATFRIAQTTVLYNTAGASGGGLVLSNGNNAVTITACVFSNNTAGSAGGGLLAGDVAGFTLTQPTVVIVNTQFVNNTAISGGGLLLGGSGALGSFAMTGCLLQANNASNGGGASTGGGMYGGGQQTFTMNNSRVIGNSAEWSGAGMYLTFLKGLILNVTFNDNSAYTGGGGVIVAVNAASYLFDSCTVNNNQASFAGAGIHCFACGGTTVTVQNSTITNNFLRYSSSSGSGLGADGSQSAMTYIVNNVNFTGNRNVNPAVISCVISMNCNSHTLIVTDSRFVNNMGGVSLVNSNMRVTLSGVTFIANSNLKGGMIYNLGRSASVFMDRCTVANNAVSLLGGVIYSEPPPGSGLYSQNCVFTIQNSRFTNNTAGQNGGVIADQSNNTYSIISSTFTQNSGPGDGGAIWLGSVPGLSVSITGSTFDRNAAGSSGGAIFNSANVSISGSTFISNTALNFYGGAVASNVATSCTTITAFSRFDSNVARISGGSIWQIAGTVILAPETVFTRNNLGSGSATPFEADFGASASCVAPGVSAPYSFPYNISGCPGLAGFSCAAVCPAGMMLNNGGPETTTCTPGGTMPGTCVAETYFKMALVGNAAANGAPAPANYGTLGVASPSNMMGARGGAAVAHSANYPNLALIICGQGVNEYGTTQYLDDTWLVDTTDPNNVTTMWIYGSRNTINDQRVSNTTANKMAPRIQPHVWVDGSTAYLFGGWGWSGAAQTALGDLWTLNMDSPLQGWVYSAMGSAIGVNPPANYGTLHQASASTHPGGRLRGRVWQMPTVLPRAALLYGGIQPGGSTLGDLWMLNCSTLLWTWMGGDNTVAIDPVYGTPHVPAATNWPGARQLPAVWVANNEVWLFGGSRSTNIDAAFNDMWKGTYDATSMTFTWTWMAGGQGIEVPPVRSAPNVFGATSFPPPFWYQQFLISDEMIASANMIYVYGGFHPYPSYDAHGETWGIKVGTGAAWLSGQQLGNAPFTDTTVFNGPPVIGTPGPRYVGVAWPDHKRPSEFFVMGGSVGHLFGGSGAQFVNQRIYRLMPSGTLQVTPTSLTTISGKPFVLTAKITLIDGSIITNVMDIKVSSPTAGANINSFSVGTGGQMTLAVGSNVVAFYQVVTLVFSAHTGRLNTSVAVNLTCPFNCDSCTPTQTPDYCSGCDYRVGLAYNNAYSACTCNMTAGLGRQLPGTTCAPCLRATGRYIADNGDCATCTGIPGCPTSQVTCSSAIDSKCAQCNSGFYIRATAGADLCLGCATGNCPSHTFQQAACSIAADRVCAPCTLCANVLGTFTEASCTPLNDTTCVPCTPVDGCSGVLTCNNASASLCPHCGANQFLISHFPAMSDVCQDCSVCPAGTYQFLVCLAYQDTTCRLCTPGCADCSSPGLTSATCSACNETLGYGWDAQGTACVNSCPDGQYMAPRNGTTPAQCTYCTYGCALCENAGLELVARDPSAGVTTGICQACNETAGYRHSPGDVKCVNLCPTGYYANDTAEPHFCHSCEGRTCDVGEYRHCTDPNNSDCHTCDLGCGVCTGPGLDTTANGECVSCDTPKGFAPDENGICVPCAANCTTCSTSPTTCITCAAGYLTPPYCAPNCSSPGCIGCLAPEACLICGPTFQGGDCKKCNSEVAQVGTTYPECVAARQTDVVSTGTSMGVLALLCIVVSVVVLMKPLPVFYGGDQTIKTPSQDIPMTVDYVLSVRRLELSLRPPLSIEKATLEGVGIMPGSIAFEQMEEKGEYRASLQMTQKQSKIFLARQMYVVVHANSGGGIIETKHTLAIPLRLTGANLLAIFTIILDFIQLSSFGFGPEIIWWRSDPVQHGLRYTLIQLPAEEKLWEIAYWVLVGLAALFILLVVYLKSGADAKLSKYGAIKTVSGALFGVVMPLVGQTLYLPIISTMLGALACSRPVTDPDGHFVANFDTSIICWNGEHLIYVAVSAVVILIYYPLAVYTSPLWQTINADLDVRYFPAFLVVSGQMKFILSVTAQLFAKVPVLLSVLLIVMPIPVVIMTLRRPPSIIYALRWPITASYASVSWSGVASIIALYYPDAWYTSLILYAGWALLLGAALIVALRKPKVIGEEKHTVDGADALRRVLAADPNKRVGPTAPKDRSTVPHGEAVDVVVPVTFAPEETDDATITNTGGNDTTDDTVAMATMESVPATGETPVVPAMDATGTDTGEQTPPVPGAEPVASGNASKPTATSAGKSAPTAKGSPAAPSKKAATSGTRQKPSLSS